MNCKDCQHFKLYKNHQTSGTCSSGKIKTHPNYYTSSDVKFEDDMIEVTYEATVGINFGCVHFKRNGSFNPSDFYECKVCGERYSTYDDLYEHYDEEHN